MRIIGGKHKRRKIHLPVNLHIRPTTDLAKESIFNVISNNFNFENISVLDLFAGTGNISYEFASRGVKQVHAVEMNYKLVKFIRQQVETLELPIVKVVRDDVHHFLNICKKKFDIIFADPPYNHQRIKNIHKLVFENNLINDDGWLIIEHGQEIKLDCLDDFVEERRYGRVHFSIFSNLNFI